MTKTKTKAKATPSNAVSAMVEHFDVEDARVARELAGCFGTPSIAAQEHGRTQKRYIDVLDKVKDVSKATDVPQMTLMRALGEAAGSMDDAWANIA